MKKSPLNTFSTAQTEGPQSPQFTKPFLHKPKTIYFQDFRCGSSRSQSKLSNADKYLNKNNENIIPDGLQKQINSSSQPHVQNECFRSSNQNCNFEIIEKILSNQSDKSRLNTLSSNMLASNYSLFLEQSSDCNKLQAQQSCLKQNNQQINNDSLSKISVKQSIATIQHKYSYSSSSNQIKKSFQLHNHKQLSNNNQSCKISQSHLVENIQELSLKSPLERQKNVSNQSTQIFMKQMDVSNYLNEQQKYLFCDDENKCQSSKNQEAFKKQMLQNNLKQFPQQDQGKEGGKRISLGAQSVISQQSSRRISQVSISNSARRSITAQIHKKNNKQISFLKSNNYSQSQLKSIIQTVGNDSQNTSPSIQIKCEEQTGSLSNSHKLFSNKNKYFRSRFNTAERIDRKDFNTESHIFLKRGENIPLKRRDSNVSHQIPASSSQNSIHNQPNPPQLLCVEQIKDKQIQKQNQNDNFSKELYQNYSNCKCETVVNCEENQQINDQEIARTITNKSLSSIQDYKMLSFNSPSACLSIQNMPLSNQSSNSNKNLSHPMLCFRTDLNTNNILGYSTQTIQKRKTESADYECEQEDEKENDENKGSFFNSIATNLKNALKNLSSHKRKQCNCETNLKDFQSCSRSLSWLQRIDKQNDLDKLKSAYCQILENSSSIVGLPFIQQIDKDLERTYPFVEFFQNKDPQPNQLSEGLAILRRVLISFAAYDPQIGYVQGMNFIAAHFIFHAEEYIAFWLLVNTFELFEMRDIYLPNLPGLKKHCTILEQILMDIDPELASHMSEQGVNPEMFMTPWLFSLFGMMIPLEFLSEFYEKMIMEGWSFFYKVVLHILIEKRSSIIYEDLMGIMLNLSAKNRSTANYKTSKEWIQFLESAQQIPLDREKLESLLNLMSNQQE